MTTSMNILPIMIKTKVSELLIKTLPRVLCTDVRCFYKISIFFHALPVFVGLLAPHSITVDSASNLSLL